MQYMYVDGADTQLVEFCEFVGNFVMKLNYKIMDESNETEIISKAQLLGSLVLLGQKKENVSEPDSDVD